MLIRRKSKVQRYNDPVSLIIECGICGGAGVGDPYRRTEIHNGRFSFTHLYGASDKTESTIAFKYNTKRKSWFLIKNTDRSYSSSKDKNPGNEIKTTLKESHLPDYGILKFENYR